MVTMWLYTMSQNSHLSTRWLITWLLLGHTVHVEDRFQGHLDCLQPNPSPITTGGRSAVVF